MATFFRRFFGILLILAAIIGLVFSIGGIIGLWQIQANLSAGLQNAVSLISQTLDTTAQGLEVTQGSLESSVATIKALQSTVETTAKTVQSTGPIIDQISSIMEDSLPNTILATQQSLDTAAQSAKAIEGVLSTLSAIPLIGSSIGYNPDVPLNTALEQVSASLTDLPDAFIAMEESLSETNSNLETFTADLSTMAASIGQVESSVAQYKSVVGGYQQSLAQLSQQMKTFSANLPNIVRMVSTGLTVFLVWMAIAQIGLFAQGWEMLTRKNQRKEEPEEKAEQNPDEQQPEAG